MISVAAPGDLKLQIAGDENLKLRVVFKPFAKERRNRPMTKSEANRGEAVIPVITKTARNTREAVIEIAGVGVYDFIVDPIDDKPVTAVFMLKLYEATSTARKRPLGKRTITAKSIVARVLMPEGILWDDESAFSGNLESSDSITRFNTDTGLVWKEYRE